MEPRIQEALKCIRSFLAVRIAKATYTLYDFSFFLDTIGIVATSTCIVPAGR